MQNSDYVSYKHLAWLNKILGNRLVPKLFATFLLKNKKCSIQVNYLDKYKFVSPLKPRVKVTNTVENNLFTFTETLDNHVEA